MKHLLLYTAILSNIITNVGFNLSALNDGVPLKKWGFLAGGLVFGLINSILFTEALKEIPLHVASAIFFSLTIVGMFLVAHFLFNESISTYKLIGAGFITVGVIIVSMK